MVIKWWKGLKRHPRGWISLRRAETWFGWCHGSCGVRWRCSQWNASSAASKANSTSLLLRRARRAILRTALTVAAFTRVSSRAFQMNTRHPSQRLTGAAAGIYGAIPVSAPKTRRQAKTTRGRFVVNAGCGATGWRYLIRLPYSDRARRWLEFGLSDCAHSTNLTRFRHSPLATPTLTVKHAYWRSPISRIGLLPLEYGHRSKWRPRLFGHILLRL